MELFKNIHVFNKDSLELYKSWDTPTCIVVDGPYGVSGYPGDFEDPHSLADFYEKHIKEWTVKSTLSTTIWFWNTEIGWALVHPIFEKYGWEYKACHIWNKGKTHIAGNVNSKTISHFPIVTEICVQYVRKPVLEIGGSTIEIKQWLHDEWKKTGLPFSKTNEACGVANAATRKYFTLCHLWYMPPVDAFEKIVKYANTYGDKNNGPFFSLNGETSLTKEEWSLMRAKFKCKFGITNVWNSSQLSGKERLKIGNKAMHFNQKPLDLINLIVECSTDENDVVWDPFGGLFTTAVSCIQLNRKCYISEISEEVYNQAITRLKEMD